MKIRIKPLLLVGSHVLAVGFGIALGIYLLPILTAPEGPADELVRATADSAQFTGEFHRDLEDSDALHWGEGTLYIGPDSIAFEGRLAPGPDYRLYLSPEFVETEAAFEALKPEMVEVGLVRTFDNFMLTVPESVDPARFNAAVVWCESFAQFITAASYQRAP